MQNNCYYGDYIQLDKLLTSQQPVSKEHGPEAHDETLFIIVHQVYELWFKQILHELFSLKNLFDQGHLADTDLYKVHTRLMRVKTIQKVLLEQIDIMETMNPADFLEFRDYLVPASGFQSVQFRQIEIILGLKTHQRYKVDKDFFLGRLNKEDRKAILRLEEEKSLFEGLEDWLVRMPFTRSDNFNFWSKYQEAVQKMLETEEKTLKTNQANLTEEALQAQLNNLSGTRQTFEALINEQTYEKMQADGKFRLKHKAFLNALFIYLYREEPMLHLPYSILGDLVDIDENFTAWRYRHALMAHRMLGNKIGTGGSSGHQYLKNTAEHNKIYKDLFNLTTFLLPLNKRPALPESIRAQLNFNPT